MSLDHYDYGAKNYWEAEYFSYDAPGGNSKFEEELFLDHFRIVPMRPSSRPSNHLWYSHIGYFQRAQIAICKGELDPICVGFYFDGEGPFRCDLAGNFVKLPQKFQLLCPPTPELLIAQAERRKEMEYAEE